MQLVAYGAQDVYLTGNPQITYFKVVYRRHTNFSIEMDELPIDTAKPGGTFTVQILRNGDLATRMFLKLQTPALTGGTSTSLAAFSTDPVNNTKVAWVRKLGHAAIKSFKIQIGGTDIDKQVGVWLDIWHELTHTSMQERGYNKMIGDVPEMTTLQGASVANQSDPIIGAYTMYIPLQFWFNRNPGLALPLIALQYHDVRLYVELEDVNKLIVWSGSTAPNYQLLSSYNAASLMVDYIYLDSEERRRFAQVGHEYLIEQVQYPGSDSINGTMSSSVTAKTKLNFNHPCKELVWAIKCGAYNGEGNKFGTNSRGRFLAYTDNDAVWENALDYAAANLAYGSLSGWDLTNAANYPAAAAPTAAAVAGGNGLPVALSLPAGVGVTAGSSQVFSTTLQTSTGKNVVFSVTVVNNATANLAAGAQVATFYTGAFIYTSTASNLMDSLARSNPMAPHALVTVTITATTSGTDTVTAIEENVVVTGHGLTLRDVSVPVKDYQDYRVNMAGQGQNNAWDVAVIQPANYGLRLDGSGNAVQQGNIQLNGHDRFDVVLGGYFNYVQPWECHTRTPADGINVYSFGLHPEQHQPSGTANLSRIDTTILNLTYSDPFRANKSVPQLNFIQDTKFYVFATNYNVLRIMSGMGGLAYSN